MSYKFPNWVEEPAKQPDAERATKRLQFIIEHLCTTTGTLRIAELARHLGVQRTSIHLYIREGRFSGKMAARFEKVLGSHLVRAKHLTDPLSIKAK